MVMSAEVSMLLSTMPVLPKSMSLVAMVQSSVTVRPTLMLPVALPAKAGETANAAAPARTAAVNLVSFIRVTPIVRSPQCPHGPDLRVGAADTPVSFACFHSGYRIDSNNLCNLQSIDGIVIGT